MAVDRVITGDHFDGRRFFNPGGHKGQPITAVPRLVAAQRTPWPESVSVQPQQPPVLGDAAAAVTFIGHSTFLIQTTAGNILTDPMYSLRASPLSFVGPRRVRQPAVPFEDLPPITLVLLSHNHYDHCDLPTLRAIRRRDDPLVVTPLGNGRLVRSTGLRRIEELDWWDASRSSPLPVALTPAQHFSARTPFDRNQALWGGFVISVGRRRIFFAGDSGYAPHFTDVHHRFGAIDCALLPIGAYEPRWFMQDIHMNPSEAVQAHLDLEATQSVGMHFGTFQLTQEAIGEPVAALEEALASRHVPASSFQALDFGGSISIEA